MDNENSVRIHNEILFSCKKKKAKKTKITRKAQIIKLEDKWMKLENVRVCKVTQIQTKKCWYVWFLASNL